MGQIHLYSVQSTMEFVAVALVLVLMLDFSNATWQKRNNEKHWHLTPEAKAQLRRALNQYIDTLCFSEDVHKQLKYGVCKRVGQYDYKRSPTYNRGEKVLYFSKTKINKK